MKSVLISINPKWCEKIANGEKTIEVRKTRPKLDTPFKCYIYQTKIRENNGNTYSDGKIIGEFVCDEIEIMRYPHINLVDIVDERESCVSAQELIQYSKGSLLYAWHISDLKIYDKPKELGEFELCKPKYQLIDKNDYISRYREVTHLRKAPQSWCYIESE